MDHKQNYDLPGKYIKLWKKNKKYIVKLVKFVEKVVGNEFNNKV